MNNTLDSIRGLLEPIADQDWHGKWRIQKVIELCSYKHPDDIAWKDIPAALDELKAMEPDIIKLVGQRAQNPSLPACEQPHSGNFGKSTKPSD